MARKYKNKNDLENTLINIARRPLDERVFANYWANPGSSFEGKNYSINQHRAKIANEENADITKTPSWLSWTDKYQIETVPVMKKGKTAIVITGDANRNKVLTVPGGAMTTVKIELPYNWDSLVSKLGYKPLDSFKINFTYDISSENSVNEDEQKTVINNRQINSQSTFNRSKIPSKEKYREIRKNSRLKRIK